MGRWYREYRREVEGRSKSVQVAHRSIKSKGFRWPVTPYKGISTELSSGDREGGSEVREAERRQLDMMARLRTQGKKKSLQTLRD